MTQPSTISMERLTDQIRKITFSNPHANLIVPETVSGLHEAVKEMSEDTQVKVAIFASSTPDYFFNHFDLSQASDFPTTPDAHSTPAWVELVLRMSKAPFISAPASPPSAPPAGSVTGLA
jgi:enoyl-CoA hydratase/carnithine racemase